MRHGSLRRAGRRGADRAGRATGDAGIARGGKLRIEWRAHGANEPNNVMMTGEAIKVFSGEVEVGDSEPVPVVK
jgi:hypothetical protein